ncbi:protein C19orf12 homolog [Sturnira hondurensis]|uniref:protein C19orf12 homolog n=1 Tax=Sturnira hondurensis TaxID=192404 RepID=UPI001879557D|nr:protein C19orf12 homolog [Sturnira hondurensis]
MPVSKRDVMRLLCSISDQKKMIVPVQPSNKSARLAVTGALIGAFLAGPPGLAVGGVFGGLLGAGMMEEPFKPVYKIVLQLSQDRQQKLFDKVKAVIWNLDWIENVELMDLVMRSERLQQQLVDVLVDFIQTELKTDVQFGNQPAGARGPQEQWGPGCPKRPVSS